jgi:hypothetical protein
MSGEFGVERGELRVEGAGAQGPVVTEHAAGGVITRMKRRAG